MTGSSAQRLFVLSIDGLPYSLMEEAFARGVMPHFQKLVDADGAISMNSVIPVISSVAWATFSTGVNPAKHGIFGFVDRDLDLQYKILTSSENRAASLWKRLNQAGKRVIAINVPGTFPPEAIDGILIGDFISPSIEKAAHPQELIPLLRELNYIIDADPLLAQTDRAAFMDELFAALRARDELTFRLLQQEDWDFFMLHVMETDRINHFYWNAKSDTEDEFQDEFWEFYRRVDDLIGRLDAELDKNTELVILSDHGFCGIDFDVDINSYLVECGFASFRQDSKSLSDLDSSSRAYSLVPGRIYLNLDGRERRGSVAPSEAAALKAEIKHALFELKEPVSGFPVIEQIWAREELYDGPLIEQAADLIAHPRRNFDLKAGVGSSPIFQKSTRSGMHTFDEAFLFARGRTLSKIEHGSILDVTPTLFDLLGLGIPAKLEGKSFLS